MHTKLISLNSRKRSFKNIPRKIISAFSSHNCQQEVAAYDYYGEECMIMVEVIGENAAVCAQEIASIASISHKHLTRSKFYYNSRVRLMEKQITVVARLVKRLNKTYKITANIAVMENNLKAWWTDIVGEIHMYVFDKQKLTRLLPESLNIKPAENILLDGLEILGLQQAHAEFMINSRYFFANSYLLEMLSIKKLESIFESNKQETDLNIIAEEIIGSAKKIDSKKTYGIYLWEEKELEKKDFDVRIHQ